MLDINLVEESIHTGESCTEKALPSCSCRNLTIIIIPNIWSCDGNCNDHGSDNARHKNTKKKVMKMAANIDLSGLSPFRSSSTPRRQKTDLLKRKRYETRGRKIDRMSNKKAVIYILYIFHLPVLLAGSTNTCYLKNILNHGRTIMISWSEGDFIF